MTLYPETDFQLPCEHLRRPLVLIVEVARLEPLGDSASVLCAQAFDPHARTLERDENGIEMSTVQIAQRAARLAADAAVRDCFLYGMLED
jgi:hypothetical protein